MALQFRYKLDRQWDSFKKEMKLAERGARKVVLGEVENTAPFARSLHDNPKYFVLSDEMLFAHVRRVFRGKPGKLYKPNKIQNMLEKAILAYIKELRSYSGSAPPFRKKYGPRKAHPGGWADITGYLNNAYRYRIDKGQWKVDPKWQAGMARANAKLLELYPNSGRRR